MDTAPSGIVEQRMLQAQLPGLAMSISSPTSEPKALTLRPHFARHSHMDAAHSGVVEALVREVHAKVPHAQDKIYPVGSLFLSEQVRFAAAVTCVCDVTCHMPHVYRFLSRVSRRAALSLESAVALGLRTPAV